MSQYIVPTSESVKTMLELLFGDGLSVSEAASEPDDAHVATYISDDDELVAVCACDDEFVGYSGAALTMVPVGVAEEMVASKDFSEMVLGNFYEVMNICSRLLMSEHSPHLRLDKTLAPAESQPAISGLPGESRKVTFEVAIPRYGKGNVAFVVAPQPA